MTLGPGTRLGPYEIVAGLGAGGMGVVYRARDTRLGREVALKFLPEGFADDPERHARFEREAKLLASLNHPNIAVLYGLEHLDGEHALAMELVEGDGLDERIARGPIPPDEAIPLALQIAEALEAAHEKGIVHRDLKPANVKVRPDGTVKVLDFGLAKTWEEEVSGSDLAYSPTITQHHTRAGVILGTAAYMSPEQARGKPVDKRADIWAFGCVLYEMLAGRKAFAGETVPDVMAAIMTRAPEWGVWPLGLAAPVRGVVRRCLERNPKDRLHDIADARLVLSDVLAGRLDEPAGGPLRAASPARRRTPWLGLVAAVLVGAALATVLARTLLSTRVPTWRGDRLVGGSVLAYGPRPSADGSLVAFLVVGEDRQSQVAVMRPGENHWTVLTHDVTGGPVLSLGWSRDGRLIYFSRPVSNAVYSVPALGGDERMVVENAAFPEALADGSIVVERAVGADQIQLFHVWPDRPREQALGPRFAGLSNAGLRTGPRAFADGREVVYFGLPVDQIDHGEPGLYAIDVENGAVRRLAPGLEFPAVERNASMPAVAVDSLRNQALVVVPRGDLHVVFAIPRSGQGAPRPLLNLTASPWALDVGPDGSLFVDQVEVLGSVLRFDATGGVPRRVARFPGAPGRSSGVLELPDGGILFTSVQAGRSVLMVARQGHGPTRFVETELETSGPAAILGGNQVALLIGPESQREIAIATLEGRILRRIPAPSPRPPTAFADLGDGRHLLFGQYGRLLAVDMTTAAARDLTTGEAGTVDPERGDLMVLEAGHDGNRVRKFGLDGTLKDDLGAYPQIFAESWVGPTIDRSGRMLLTLGLPGCWFVGPGLFIPEKRRMQPISLDFYGDVFTPSWAPDGSIVAIGWEYSANVWRFAETGRVRREASGP